jgi:hypothetical protein
MQVSKKELHEEMIRLKKEIRSSRLELMDLYSSTASTRKLTQPMYDEINKKKIRIDEILKLLKA